MTPPKKPTSKIGMSQLGNRAVAEATAPSDKVGQGSNRSQTYTYFTKIGVGADGTPILYNADRLWTRVTLQLETAGPVAVGNVSQITPVLSGKGQLLETDEPVTFTLAKGTRLYIVSSSVNRVKVTIEPFPWLEQITAIIGNLVHKLTGKPVF